MKILFYTGSTEPDVAIFKLRERGYEVIQYDAGVDKDEIWHSQNKTFQMYERLFNKAEELDVDYLYFVPNITIPYFYYELKSRPFFKPKVIFQLAVRGFDRSFPRCLALKDLVNLPQVKKVIVLSMMGKDGKLPDDLIRAGIDMSKIVFVPEPYCNETEDMSIFSRKTKEEAREFFGINKDAFVITFTGTWNLIKGPDIFLDALKYIDEDITILIHRHTWGIDKSLPEMESALQHHKKTIFIDKRLSREEYPLVMMASNAVVCSHRKSYAYTGSGIPELCYFAKTPIIAPDFYAFNALVKKYKVGVLYEAENSQELGKAINYTKENYDEIMKVARFDDAKEGIMSWTDTPLLAFEK
jgi:glycosyltransferase involved in cell wall biosynthesis